jgi:hypothetical protein
MVDSSNNPDAKLTTLQNSLTAFFAALNTDIDKMVFGPLEYWSTPQTAVVLPAAVADQALPDVVVASIPTGATVLIARAIFRFRRLQNAGAANNLNGDQYISCQKGGAGGYSNAIKFPTNLFDIGAGVVDAPGSQYDGEYNIVAKVDGNGTYNFKWYGQADVDNLTFTDVLMGLKIWYTL